MLIKDLGLTDLDGKLTKKRPFLLVQCDKCNTAFTVRKDAYKSDQCCSCNRKDSNRSKANVEISKGLKTCTMCKLELPLSSFGKKSDILSGYRGNCKQCEKTAYETTRKNYRADPINKQKKRIYDQAYTQLPHRKQRSKELN